MHGVAKKHVVVAAAEGLFLYPSGQRNQRCLQIRYATCKISSTRSSAISDDSALMDIHGIVGLLTLDSVSYLIAIVGREQVAQIRGFHVYVLTRVTLIPLSSRLEAEKVIDQIQETPHNVSVGRASPNTDTETSDEEDISTAAAATDGGQTSPANSETSTKEDRTDPKLGVSSLGFSEVGEDVIGRKGQYGRFTERWFSKKGWSAEKRRTQGMSTDDVEKPRSGSAQGGIRTLHPKPEEIRRLSKGVEADNDTVHVATALMPKLLRTTRILLESRSFFFSYESDITRRVGTQENKSSGLPLHKSVDPLFFWNRHLLTPLIEGGHTPFILPLMQGFVGQRTFTVDRETRDPTKAISDTHQDIASVVEDRKFLITLISRRSVERPGLRYLRRGVDDNGDTANTVETEQILSRASWASSRKVYSVTQIRGSIPLFFSQSPYSFKPVPVLQHTLETNQRALQHHFEKLVGRYGHVQIASLVDKKGREAEIGQKYNEIVASLNSDNGIEGTRVGFEWFDFHAVCRGMQFENVTLLMDALGPKLTEFGDTVEIEGKCRPRQSGILRTNCMDCLDRTNVVQSACGRRALEQQLEEEGARVDLFADTDTQWFNTLWADNGDQISREYSGTAALKGDYTRTRQRNYRGAINDLGLTLSRYYNNIVNDYFSQAVIDYLLGKVSSHIFDEFEETLESRDPAMSMAKIRANAIETSLKIVIADPQEELISGWTLLSPRESNTVRTFPFEECVFLVTDAALYGVKFDWTLEKVTSFERVELRNITGIIKGTYIISTLAATQTDPERNVGLVVRYKSGINDVARVNTRSLSNSVGSNGIEPPALTGASSQTGRKEQDARPKALAFKALPSQDSFINTEGQERQTMSEKDLVDHVCAMIRRAVLGNDKDPAGFIEESDIISLEEAKKSTSFLEQWGHSLKKMVWA